MWWRFWKVKILSDYDHVYVDSKVRDNCHITGKYRGSAHRDGNVKIKLNHKISIVFHNNYDLHVIMQELSKFNFKINVIPHELEKHMSFNINDKLIFSNSFQYLTSSLDILIKSFVKNDFKYLGQEFHRKKLHLVKQKALFLYEYTSDFEKFQEELPCK